MSPVSRLLSNCGNVKWDNGQEKFYLSIGTFLRQLILFDEIIVQSVRLKEFGPLIDLFGFKSVMSLLDSGAIRLRCEALTIGEAGQTKGLAAREGKPPLPLNHFYFICIAAAHRNEYLVGCLPSLNSLASITIQQKDALMAKVLDHIEDPIDAIRPEMLNQTMSDFRNNIPTIKYAVSTIIKESRNIVCSPEELTIKIEETQKGEFQAESNLGNKLGIPPEEEHRIIQGALLSIGHLNQRIAEMKAYEALTGFSVHDIPMFDAKLRFLVQRIDPDISERNFIKVLGTLGLPELGAASVRREVNLERILRVRKSRECQEFRQWLATASDISSRDFIKAMRGLRTKIGEIVSSPCGKVCRFLVAGGISIPCWPAGLAISALDLFLLERLFPRNRVAGFLDKMYPSVFEVAETRSNN